MSFDLNGTRKNFKEGAVRVKDALKGPYILGIRNPSALESVKVSIEIVSIVAQKAFRDGEYEKSIDYEKKAIALDST